MADHTVDMLHSAIRAMQDVVLPAVDREHPLALEQATLVTRILQLLEQRVPFLLARNRFELLRAVTLAEAVAENARSVSTAIAQALASAAITGRSLLRDPGASSQALQDAARELGGLCTVLVEVAQDGEPVTRRRIDRRVLASASQVLAMQRAWFQPQGWEPDPDAIAPLEGLLAGVHEEGAR